MVCCILGTTTLSIPALINRTIVSNIESWKPDLITNFDPIYIYGTGPWPQRLLQMSWHPTLLGYQYTHCWLQFRQVYAKIAVSIVDFLQHKIDQLTSFKMDDEIPRTLWVIRKCACSYRQAIVIAMFIGPTWGPSGPCRSPCWPHELCYLGMYGDMTWDT